MQFINGVHGMRSLADALAALDESSWSDGALATINACPLKLPDGNVVLSVALIGPGEPAQLVTLPAPKHFSAKDGSGARGEYQVQELDSATVDSAGNVQLRDGRRLRAVQIVPVHLPEELTEKEQRILICVLDILDARKDCFRPLHRPDSKPQRMVLDYALVAQLGRTRKLPSLKELEWRVQERMPEVTRQTLANVLARAGLRVSKRGSVPKG